MAPGCSDSDSERERHDRFKSERNPTSLPSVRPKIPSSLESYLPRARSPSRPVSFKSSSHRSRYSEERKHSPHRRRSRDRIQSRENDRRSSSREHKERHRRKRSHDKSHDDSESRKKSKEAEDKYVGNGKDSKQKEHKHRSHRERKISSIEKDRKVDCIKRRKSRDELLISSQTSAKPSCQDKSSSEKSRDSDSSVSMKSDSENCVASDVETPQLPRYYEIVDECAVDSDQKNHIDDRNSKKHKKTKMQNHHDSKKRKKEKKHKKKHEKRKSGSESDSKIVEDTNKVENSSSNNDSTEPTSDNPISNELPEEKINEDKENDITIHDSDSEHASEENNDIKRPNSEQEEGELSGSESEQYFGPALPPGKKAEKVYGPMRPSEEDLYGPALPPASALPTTNAEEEDVVGDVIGPLPAGHESNAQSALDARASLLKYHMDNKPDEENQTKREAWMTELPEARKAQIGLGPRKFRPNAGPDMSDRSSWSDTPQDKLKKLLTDEPTELDSRKLEIIERNKEMELLAKKSEKKSKSLMDMHQKELKKKKKKEKERDKDKRPERRPFSREIDLHANIIDEAKTKSIIKRSQILDTRFSAGESKFL